MSREGSREAKAKVMMMGRDQYWVREASVVDDIWGASEETKSGKWD